MSSIAAEQRAKKQNFDQEKTFFFSYLYSENKTKPKNHGLRRCCKTSPPLIKFKKAYFFKYWNIALVLNVTIDNSTFKYASNKMLKKQNRFFYTSK